MRERVKQATPWIGYQCGDKPLRHRCVRPNDAKQENLVLLDVRNAGNEKVVLIGDWEGYYQLAAVSSTQVDNTEVANNATDEDFVLYLSRYVGAVFYRLSGQVIPSPLGIENTLRS